MKNRIAIVAASIVLASLVIQPAQAGPFGAALGGALRGAIVGDLIGGRDGAEAGAIVGGMIGAGESISRKKRAKRERQRRKAEWAQQQQAQQARTQQRAAAAPAVAANQTLIIETQKSLIRLGYEPGALGQAGPQLTQAVIEYQRSKGLLETGELSQALLTHMLRNGG